MLDYADELERSQQIEASTATNYRSSIKHLARYLEGYSIEEIAPENVMDVQVALLADGLVVDTVAKDHRFFKQVMATPARWAISIAAPSTRRPSRRSVGSLVRTRSTRGAVRCFYPSWTRPPRPSRALRRALGLLAGLRREEVAGLRWGDVDLVANRIRVGRAVGV